MGHQSGAHGDEVLRLESVGVTLGGRRVLEDVSFDLHAGEFIGLIGSNGAGKTTLLRVVLGLQRPTTGRLFVDSHEGARRSRSIGYVPQKTFLDPDFPLRARDLVALGLDGHRYGVPLRSTKRAGAVDEMLHAVAAEHFANSRVGELSGGEQQRVLIAHALISRPRLLLLDEPLANLDIRSGQEIVEVLDRVAKEHGVTVLLSAHEMNQLLPVMDRLVYLAGGRAATGTTEEVVRPDVLSRLYGHHVDVLRVHGRVLIVTGPATDGEDALALSPVHVFDRDGHARAL